jgi:dihydrolipoamide dehydrogenase
MEECMKYDVVVIGGGPGGYVAAIKAAQMGKSTCIIEKNAFGGTCLNIGCIPTKTLLKSVEILREIRMAKAYGIKNIDVDAAKLDLIEVQGRKASIVNQLVTGVEGLLKKNKVAVIKGEAHFVDKHNLEVDGKRIEGENIIIATGSSVKKLPIEMDADMPVYTSTEILDMVDPPDSIAIIGGGVIGVELAYYLVNIGVKVTIIEYMDRILPMVDREITKLLTNQFIEMGVEVWTEALVTSVEKEKVLFENQGQKMEIPCDAVLLSAGREPYIEGLNLNAVGILVEKGAIVTDDRLATSVDNIFAVGDVNGRVMLAHTASMEGIVAVENICGNDRSIDYGKIPSAVYIKPEIASIGDTEEEAKSKYIDIRVGRFPLTANGKAKIEGEERGLVKVITEARYGEIVGVHIYCVHATDMIAEMSVAMKLECTAEELVECVHPHPTISEVIHEACHAALHKAIHN